MTSFPTSTDAVSKTLKSAAPIAFVVVIAAITGALTPIGEQLLPHSIRSMANSSGPWTLIAFASIYLSRSPWRRAAILGAASFLIMDLVFSVVFDGLGAYYPRYYVVFWAAVAIVIGPLVGICASWLRGTDQARRAVAIAAPAAVLVGEGVYMLVEIPGESTVYAVASVVVGVLLLAVLVALVRLSAAMVALSALASAIGASAFFAVYGLLPLVLGKVVP